MSSTQATVRSAMSIATWRRWRERWSAGLSWKGFAIVFAFSAINALRRNINSRELWEDPRQWLIDVANAILTGTFVVVLVVIAVIVVYNRSPLRGWRLFAMLTLAVAAASLTGSILLNLWEIYVSDGADSELSFLANIFGAWPRYMLLGLLFAGAYVYFRRKRENVAAMRQLEVDRVQIEQSMVEARLTVLQAQIEPHFLFNTLANVKRLYATDPVAASVMLDNLMRYLAIALPRMRESESTVERETSLAKAYLNIQKIRMGRRLEFMVDMPVHLRDARMPPMMLLTLVENSIKHGLNPWPEGGAIHISARAVDDMLSVEVSDSGRGFTDTSGVGTGLANLRARLSALYGSAGSLDFSINAPRGVIATITLPNVASSASESAA